MQLKFYKRSTVMLSIVVLIDIVSIFLLLKYREAWADRKISTILLFALFISVLQSLYSYYDLNADRILIKKRVSNGDVALAKIKDGSFVRFGRNARLKNHVYWKLNVEIYDNDMHKFETSIIEKFSTHQTSIPKGYVYVAYVEGKAEESLIIPNVIISSIPEYRPLVEEYEKALKPTYLNAYIMEGLMLETYKESLKKQDQ